MSSDLFPDSKVNVANMGPTWVLSSPGGPHAGPMNLAIRVVKISEPWYILNWLTALVHCGLVTSYGKVDQSQYYLK